MSASKNFTYDVEDGVAFIWFDMEGDRFNTLEPHISSEFETLMTRAASDERAKAIVFISRKKDSFIAGANIELLRSLTSQADAAAMSRQAQAGFDRLDAFEKPVVAAIHGACLGGGLEWALACDYRIATDHPKTVIGLPETQLGLIPGAGGTQRLPRLIGAQGAIELILSGRSLKAKKAFKLGIIDEVVPHPILKDIARARAMDLAEGKLKIDRSRGLSLSMSNGRNVGDVLRGLTSREAWSEMALEDNPLGRKVLIDQSRKRLLKKTRGRYPAPEQALEVIRMGLEKGMKAGLEAEAQAFGELLMGDVSKRLVEIYFATTALKKENGLSNPLVVPREIRKVGVVGGGLMGSGIAFVSAGVHGVQTRLKERDDAGMERSLRRVKALFDDRVERRSMSWRDAEKKFSLLSETTDWSGFRRCDLVVEAVFEDLALKRQVVAELESVCAQDAIIASSTSSIPIAQVAEGSKHPERMIGMHYFSPVQKMPLLEIVVHRQTAEWVTATCVDTGRKQGKMVIVVNDGPGFYTSRILAPYLNEAAHLLAEGVEIAEIDRSLSDFGFPVGPLMLLDEIGLDVAGQVSGVLREAIGGHFQSADLMDRMRQTGRLGRKAKKGFYIYQSDGSKDVDAGISELVPSGAARRRADRFEVAERCVLQMVNEAVRCLGEGILRNARDGDMGAIFGLGFPAFLGGPFRYCDSQGLGKILQRTEHYEERFGKRFSPAPLFVEHVKAGRKFYEGASTNQK